MKELMNDMFSFVFPHRLKWGKFQQSSVSPTVQNLGRGSFQKENTVVVTRKFQ